MFLNSKIYTWICTIIILVIIWGILIYTISPKFNTFPLRVEQRKRIQRVLEQLNKSSQKNLKMLNFIENYLNNLYIERKKKSHNKIIMEKLEYQMEYFANILLDSNSSYTGIQPSSEYEQLRRRSGQNTLEMWNYFSSKMEKIRIRSENTHESNKEIRNSLELGAEYKISIISHIDRMRMVDGYETWRQKEAEDLSDLVQRRLYYIQNPKDCKNTKKILCDLNLKCGFGCQLHHIVYCFIVAYATERTLILKSKGWQYHQAGWDEVFQSVSKTCTEYDVDQIDKWPSSLDTKVIILPIIGLLVPQPSYLPLTIPEDLAQRLTKLHGDPSVWWIGQFLKYLFKPKDELQKILETSIAQLGWKKPYVGVHIRRTDKVGTEAAFHSVEEYMKYVEDYYRTLEFNTKVERRVFLASDDPRVITEARTKYPKYIIIGDADIVKAVDVSTRYTDLPLNGIIFAIHMLSLSDYLVCTFSSQVCRIAYEIMQNYYPDAYDRFKSLDDIYFFAGQNDHDREALVAHKQHNKDEIDFAVGDLVHVIGNNWNGFSIGRKRRTHKTGFFPSYKVKDKIIVVKLSTYPNSSISIKLKKSEYNFFTFLNQK